MVGAINREIAVETHRGHSWTSVSGSIVTLYAAPSGTVGGGPIFPTCLSRLPLFSTSVELVSGTISISPRVASSTLTSTSRFDLA